MAGRRFRAVPGSQRQKAPPDWTHILFSWLAVFIVTQTLLSADPCLTKNSPITWLACQHQSSPYLDPGDDTARLINSREGGLFDGRAWLFDQAQAIIAFTVAGERIRAQEILNALAQLQVKDGSTIDGSWCNSYDTSGVCVDSLRHSGAIAWVVLAVNYYEWVEHDVAYQAMGDATLRYLEGLINTNPSTEEFGAVAFGPDFPTRYSAEHQVDAYSAFTMRHWLHGGGWEIRAERMRLFLLSPMQFGPCESSDGWKVWLDIWQKIFNAGGACVPEEYYACTQSWAALSLGVPRMGELDYHVALDSIWDGGVLDMVTSDVYERPADYSAGPDNVPVEGLDLGVFGTATNFVYFIGEAGGGYEAADRLFGDGTRAHFLQGERAKVLYPDGGVPYSTDPNNDTHKAVASTAWYYFNAVDPPVNPFNPLDFEVRGSLRVIPEGASVRLAWDAVPASGTTAYDIFRGTQPNALSVIDQVVDQTQWIDPAPLPLAYYAVTLRRQ